MRGYRIELGEIEAALAAHASVAQAVVTTREERAGDVRLVAYLVLRGGSALDEAALRAHLAGLLPDYMMPQHFVSLEALPLTPSGKVDRKALPAPVAKSRDESAYVAPRSATETLLAGLWEQALGVRRIGVHDDFFALGGHSLLAAQVLSRLNREHAIVLPFRSIFEAPTIERFAALVDGRSREERERAVTRIPRRTTPEPAPVSLMQERILLLEELDPERGLVHAVPSAFRLEGPLDAGALKGALNDVVRRQESLRTTFRKDGSSYVQVVADSLELELEMRDLRELEASEREPALRAALDRETQRRFDLERGPLFRACLLRLQDEEHVLFTLRHNAIWDGWSFDIFRHELATFYEARLAGRAAVLPELALGYGDFAAWHRGWLASPEIEAQLAFWRERLAGSPAPVELPTDRPRPAVRSYAGADEWLHIPRAEADLLAELGRELGATTFMVLLAAFGVLLQRYSGRSDILIASPVRNRPRPEIEDLIGLFTNTLMLRNNIDPALSFASLVKQVRATTLDAFSHQEAPYDLLAREAPPLRVIFSLQEARHRETALGSLRLSLPHVLPPAAAVDMNFWLVEMKDGLKGALNYSTELFDPATIRTFLSHFRELLMAIRENPGQAVGQLRLVSAQERRHLVAQTAAVEPPAASLLGALAARAAAQPEGVALRLADGFSTTYAALLAEATGRAAWLAERGVRAGDRVALALEDGQQRLASLLGLLWLGAVAVPLDPRDPAARHEARIAVSGATWLWGATEDATLPASRVLPPLTAAPPSASGQGAPEDGSGTAWVETAPAPGGGFAAFPVLAGPIAGRLDAASRQLGLAPAATLATLPAASMFVSLLGLAAGATMAVADEEASEDGSALAAWLRTVGASALVAPAAAWRRLLAAGWSPGSGFVAVAEEPLPEDTARGLLERGVATFLAWGLEEAGGWCSLAPVEAGSDRPRLAPLPGVLMEVLEPSLEPAPAGVPGQLHVGAFGRARSYSSQERARRRDDGTIERLERTDDALVRAGRVELREVRASLTEHPAVADAAVLWHRDTTGDPRLVAYVVGRPGTNATDTELRRHLKRALPPEAVPRHFVSVPSLTRQADGKVDARVLPAPFASRAAARPPSNDAERLLVELWQGALGLPRVDVADNFFDLGGHSLLCLQLVSQIAERTGRQLKPRLLLLSTLEQVAAELAREPWTRP